VSELPYGTRLVAGLGYSTVIGDFDFETYSEAGLEWDAARQRWTQPKGATGTATGLSLVGAAVYSQHPSTEVLSLAYNLKDGAGPRWWRPGYANPEPLFEHLRRGLLLEAWNVSFEAWIWREVCERLYGWPPLKPHYRQLRCAMAKSRAFGLPGKLAVAGQVLGVPIQKDADGDRLLNKFSKPRNPTKADPRLRLRPEEDSVDGPRLYAYNMQDIEAEAEVSARCPDLEGEELEFWLVDQAINRRGVHIDREGAVNCAAIVTAALERYNTELATLTGGVVESASKVEALRGWLGAHGVHMASLDEDTVAEMLKERDRFPAPAVRALEIRQAVGSASVKKVFAMLLRCARGDRLHDLFLYHAARTGRPTGAGVQPTNMPKAGPDIVRCGYTGKQAHAAGCGHYHGARLTKCPWCGVQGPPGRVAEWNADAAEDALIVIATRSLAMVEAVFGDAMLTISGCLRGLFTAAPGTHLASSDFTAIEAVVTAALAGEEWRLQAFRDKVDIYLESIARSTGIPVAEMKAHRATTGMHHPLRAKGKIQELACFTAETQVLTDRGYVGILGVLPTDKVWDGKHWVGHSGVVPRGVKHVLNLDGVGVTPEHLIICGDSWREAKQLVSHANILSQALESGSANLPLSALSSGRTQGARSSCSALAGQSLISWRSQAYEKARRLVATFAQNSLPQRRAKIVEGTPRLSPISLIGVDYSHEFQRASIGAITPRIGTFTTTVAGAFTFMPLGERIERCFSHTWSHLRDGMTRISTWIAARWNVATNPGISGSSRGVKTATTSEPCERCSNESLPLRSVYDLAHAGPLNRFTIRTNTGHLLVHNCGFMGWIGALRAFGAEGNDDELKQQVLAWRGASPAIVELAGGQTRDFGRSTAYFGMEGASVLAMLHPGVRQYPKRLDGQQAQCCYIYHGNVLYLELPSGRRIAYQSPKLTATGTWRGYRLTFETWNTNPKKGPPGWITADLYAGTDIENLVQAAARDIQRRAIIMLERSGYPVVLHVYDENASETTRDVEGLEAIMSTMPEWAQGWPVAAAGGWTGQRYRKE
jgi:DNA polymerase